MGALKGRGWGRIVLVVSIAAVVGLSTSVTSALAARWGMSVFGGITASGTLYKARAASENDSRQWEIPAGGTSYEGSEVRADIQEFGVGGIRAVGIFDSGFGVNASVSMSDLDVRALVRSTANNVTELDWDQLFVINVQLVATYDLIRERRSNSPYLLLGAGLSSLGSEGGAIDQTRPALVWGGGLRIRSIEGIHIDLDARDAIVIPNLDDEESRLRAASFDASDRIHLWEITAGWTYMF